jgi:lysylphosphatidylglycerol synthetase-like protein (DUF2156 family)
MREVPVGRPYRGKRERPLSRTERRQLVALAVGTLVGLAGVLIGVMMLAPAGHNRLSPVLVQTGTLVVLAAGLLSMRHAYSVRQRRFHAAVIAALAVLWLVSVLGYVSDW